MGKTLGRFLKQARLAKGLTLTEVGKALRIKSGQSVWDWENNKGSGVPAEMLLRLAKLYGISADKLYDYLLEFHIQKTRRKVEGSFQKAKMKIYGSKKA